MIPLLASVRLKEPDVVRKVSPSDRGVVVDVLGNGEAYTVEFFDQEGNSNLDALSTEYREEQLEIIE